MDKLYFLLCQTKKRTKEKMKAWILKGSWTTNNNRLCGPPLLLCTRTRNLLLLVLSFSFPFFLPHLFCPSMATSTVTSFFHSWNKMKKKRRMKRVETVGATAATLRVRTVHLLIRPPPPGWWSEKWGIPTLVLVPEEGEVGIGEKSPRVSFKIRCT